MDRYADMPSAREELAGTTENRNRTPLFPALLTSAVRVRSVPVFCLLVFLLFACFGWDQAVGAAAKEAPWRIRFLDAAVVNGPVVTLGEVAVPVGDIPPGTWEELSRRELWPAPPEGGKAMHMTRPKLQEAIMATMRDLAPYCLFPGGMALQRGGRLMGKDDIQRLIDKELAPLLASLPGETVLKDYRIPQYIFLDHGGQELGLEAPKRVSPGRLGLRLLVRELDGSVRQRLTGSVFLDCWAEVPCATAIMNREDLLDHTKITFKRMSLAGLRSDPWDGLGGPWRVMRPIGVDQVVYKSDLANIPTVRKGSAVNLIYSGRNIHLTMRAEALADGVAGETIPVRNLQSRKEIYGIVRDAATVVVNAAP